MNTNILKQALIKTVREIKETKDTPAYFKTSKTKFLNVFIPMEYFKSGSYKDTLNKFLKHREVSNKLSSTQIIITLNSMIKALLESEELTQEAGVQIDKLKNKLENTIEHKIYVPIRGIKMSMEFFSFGEKATIMSEEKLKGISFKDEDSLNFLAPVAMEIRVESADHLKAMEIGVEATKIVLHFLRLVDYLTWDEKSLGLRLPGFGASTDELRVVAVADEIQYDWRLKEAAIEEFEIDLGYTEDAQKLGIQKFGLMTDKYLSNTLEQMDKSIIRSLIWFGESRMDHDIASRFLKLMLAIECVLNSSDNAPINATLSERVAFILGDDIEERLRLVKQMKTLYSIRSRITHHGSTDAGYEELLELESIVAQLILEFLTNKEYVSLVTKEDLTQLLELIKYN
jgi:hypothetical protein